MEFSPGSKKSIHIGHKIEAIVAEKRLTHKEFGNLIHRHEKTVPDIFKRSTITVDLLVTISGALKVDLFALYYEEEPLKSLRNDEITDLNKKIEELYNIIRQLEKDLVQKEKLIDAQEQYITIANERMEEYKRKDAKKDDNGGKP